MLSINNHNNRLLRQHLPRSEWGGEKENNLMPKASKSLPKIMFNSHWFSKKHFVSMLSVFRLLFSLYKHHKNLHRREKLSRALSEWKQRKVLCTKLGSGVRGSIKAWFGQKLAESNHRLSEWSNNYLCWNSYARKLFSDDVVFIRLNRLTMNHNVLGDFGVLPLHMRDLTTLD